MKENYTKKCCFFEKNIPTWHKKYAQLVWVPREKKEQRVEVCLWVFKRKRGKSL